MHIMINILLLTMLVSAVYNFVFKKKFYTLNCGIFAWVGSSSDKFNPILFNVLGVYNDSRGGDSCGIYYNKTYTKGIGKLSHYQDLVINEHLMSKINPGKSPVVIGHTRKASVGAISFENTQPVLIEDDKKKVCYVQAHNGTLSNHQELAKKYKIETKTGETDSNILAKLISKHGFDILKEYEGTAALVMYFPKEPGVLYAFHGKSTKWSYYPSEERPLHYINNEEMGTYISSESTPLQFIGDGNIEVHEFKYNVLYRLEGDNVEELRVIDRTQEKKKTTPVVGFNYSNRNLNNEFDFQKNSKTKNICEVEIGRTNGNIKDDVLRYTRGFFYCGADLAHGHYNCDNWGYINMYYAKGAPNRYHLWFFMGILLCNEKCYYELLQECYNKKIDAKKSLSNYDDYKALTDILKRNSVYPFTRKSEYNTGVMMGSSIITSTTPYGSFFTGSFTALFSDQDLYFSGGDYVGKSKSTGKGMYTITELMYDYTDLFIEGFGDEPKDDTNIKETKTTTKEDKEQEDSEQQVILEHAISSQIAPIVKSLENVINDIEISGFKGSVQETFEIISSSTNNLKAITV